MESAPHGAGRCEDVGMPAHILIVDDDPSVATILGFVLSDNGYRATALTDPDAVLPFLDAHPVDLVLLGVRLRTDRLALRTAIRRTHPDIPILSQPPRSRLSRGAGDAVTPPIEPMGLLKRIQAALRRPRRT